MRLSAMGDVAMTVPVLRTLVKQYPDVKVTMISRALYRPFFDDIPNVDFFVFDAQGKHKGVLGLLQLYWDLKPLKIDFFADLHNVLRSKFIRSRFALKGTKVAATDKGRAEKKALTRAENKIFKPLPTMLERHAKTFERLGFKIDLSKPVFSPKQKPDTAILDFTTQKNKPWIGIAPFAQYDSKVYPADLMHEVIRQLAQNKEYEIFLFGGGQHEIVQLDSYAKENENVKVVAGKFSLQQ